MTDVAGLVGGAMLGLTQGKAEAQNRQMMESYRKNQEAEIKAKTQLIEAQLRKQAMEEPIYEAIAQAARGGGMPGAAQPPGAGGFKYPFQSPSSPVPPGTLIPLPQGSQPGVMGREVPPPPAAMPLPDIMAQGQIQIPPGNLSYKNNNPGNLRFVGQEGAAPGQGGFAQFPSPEAGYSALMRQIEIDKGRNLNLSQFINKYAPPSENDTQTYIANASKLLGVSPDTPLNSIPTGQIAPVIAKLESSTVVNPSAGVQSPGTRPVPTTPGPSPIGITGQKLLEGFLKKNFGVEPDEVKYQKMGSHLWVLDKQGKVMGVYPGQGEYKPVEVKNPDGSVTQVMQMIPPSPLPPGVPVFSMPGGGNGLGATPPQLGPQLQVAPPAYNYQDVKTPSGATNKVAVPQAQPGFSFQAEPSKVETQEAQGIPVADVGRTNMILHAESKLGNIKQMLISPEGKVNRGLIFKAAAPAGGIGEGSTLYSRMYQAVDAALRLETGAQANADEIKIKMQEYWPSWKDTDAVVKNKIADLNEYISRTVALHDPTGKLRELGRKAYKITPDMPLPPGAPKVPSISDVTSGGAQGVKPGIPKGPKSAEDYLKMKGIQ